MDIVSSFLSCIVIFILLTVLFFVYYVVKDIIHERRTR